MKKVFLTLVSLLALPFAWYWLWHNEKIALRLGRSLNEHELKWAEQLGILNPRRVRILQVARIPSPVPLFIENFMQKRGYPVGNAAGMCMRYGIYLHEKYAHSDSLIAHEMVHTAQFERLGGLWKFLRIYLHQTLTLGYLHAPLEKEANHKADQVLAQHQGVA